ncbi:uncharacterized protein EV422DRAFT_510112 [Fimicolochytrium jonesii]|uniref:uncharacterized protein n=1 Tax=Fimicolochytrium jonesii TaxID=1396493 RepID=UPI0022FDD443|nr:uncharacterized protein EV422DRAFT_510112 [Fimicolochytrium jonesii]KAI8816113.1 hypothetical protein EV422DRAFT_510112 [Fimicolochytrium jonesii]
MRAFIPILAKVATVLSLILAASAEPLLTQRALELKNGYDADLVRRSFQANDPTDLAVGVWTTFPAATGFSFYFDLTITVPFQLTVVDYLCIGNNYDVYDTVDTSAEVLIGTAKTTSPRDNCATYTTDPNAALANAAYGRVSVLLQPGTHIIRVAHRADSYYTGGFGYIRADPRPDAPTGCSSEICEGGICTVALYTRRFCSITQSPPCPSGCRCVDGVAGTACTLDNDITLGSCITDIDCPCGTACTYNSQLRTLARTCRPLCDSEPQFVTIIKDFVPGP